MTVSSIPNPLRQWRPGPAAQLGAGLGVALAIALAVVGPDRLWAQIEGDRGIAPIASTSDIQIGGIQVNTTGKNPAEARAAGWKMAQRKAWEALKGAPMGDDQIGGMVSAVVIEQEQIGPRRYIATLGVIFDRTKAGQFLPVTDGGVARARSAPLLVIPVLTSGGVSQVFEVRGAWQRAWANFRTGASPIDYVRPSGAGGDSLILTAGQPGRRSRTWWRNVLDQFGAADVITPIARLERQWPGGPILGTFTARYGPDNTYLDSFTLTANGEAGVPAMLNQALVRIDGIYAAALARGELRPDPTLIAEQKALDAAMSALAAQARARVDESGPATAVPTPGASPGATSPAGASAGAAGSAAAKPTIATYVVQFASPDAADVDAALSAVRGAPGVQGASTSSIAIGGTSVMHVTVAGDLEGLAAGLRARGWQVTVGNNALSIRR